MTCGSMKQQMLKAQDELELLKKEHESLIGALKLKNMLAIKNGNDWEFVGDVRGVEMEFDRRPSEKERADIILDQLKNGISFAGTMEEAGEVVQRILELQRVVERGSNENPVMCPFDSKRGCDMGRVSVLAIESDGWYVRKTNLKCGAWTDGFGCRRMRRVPPRMIDMIRDSDRVYVAAKMRRNEKKEGCSTCCNDATAGYGTAGDIVDDSD